MRADWDLIFGLFPSLPRLERLGTAFVTLFLFCEVLTPPVSISIRSLICEAEALPEMGRITAAGVSFMSCGMEDFIKELYFYVVLVGHIKL